MAQGGGSANALVGGLLLLLCVLQCAHLVERDTYIVGGRQGWNLQSKTWIVGKRFRAGDTLVFNYNTSVHNVVVVSVGAYKRCSTAGFRPLTSGSDKVTLSRGVNYFICGAPDHCIAGMKIAVSAT